MNYLILLISVIVSLFTGFKLCMDNYDDKISKGKHIYLVDDKAYICKTVQEGEIK